MTRLLPMLLAVVPLWGCPGTPTTCDDLFAERGEWPCRHLLADRATWDEMSVPAPEVDRVRVGKFLVPGNAAQRIDPVLVNPYIYDRHSDFLADVYGDAFPLMNLRIYSDKVFDPDDDDFFSGDLLEMIGDGGQTAWGFTLWDDARFVEATVREPEVQDVARQLAKMFRLGPLVFVPITPNQEQAAATWTDVDVWDQAASVRFEAYTPGTAYGTIKRLRLQDLDRATAAADYGPRDILVLDQAPIDVERVVSAVVTGTRQGSLSHINVRSAARGTPNCFVHEAMAALAPWEGELVRLTCEDDTWQVEPATTAEAEPWWSALRPEPAQIIPADLTDAPLLDLTTVPTNTSEDRQTSIARYGAKGANLATLYQHVPLDHRVDGFLVPMAAYATFMETTGWTRDLGDGLAWHSFADTIEHWLQDPGFLDDPRRRAAHLADLRQTITRADVAPELLDQIIGAIRTHWPDTTMVRFRSSSNAEDALGFSGAGLYTSTNACVADSLDDDDRGPSRCDVTIDSERSLTRALTKVWASLWNLSAYEERDWYGIDHRQVAMGILVNTRHGDERANIVAFDGNPTSDDPRFLVQAQVGELKVVAADPGVVPEVSLLTVTQGVVDAIERVQGSSEVEGLVLPDPILRELGETLARIDASYPQEDPPDGALWDTEWKVTAEGNLLIKQIRPFVSTDSP